MDRLLSPFIQKDLTRKIVLLSGPRQCGKTTLARMLSPRYDYFNYDDAAQRLALRDKTWDRNQPLVIFDELHKMPQWKTWLKAVYDVEGIPPAYVVTGSANLETFRKMGDSLAGRFFAYHLHPLDAQEVASQIEPHDALSRLLRIGGFPEPFLENDEIFYARWKRSHLDVILRQDLLDLVAVTDIQSIETLIELLRHRVGSPLSYANLASDLQKDPQTVKSWLALLEGLYVIFAVRPWHRNVARSILKEPKYYFYDTGQVKGDEGTRLENVVATALRKQLDFLADTRGLAGSLHYIRTKDGKELDFGVAQDERLSHVVEVKWADSERSPSFSRFPDLLKQTKAVQVVGQAKGRRSWPDGLAVEPAADWLARLDLLR